VSRYGLDPPFQGPGARNHLLTTTCSYPSLCSLPSIFLLSIFSLSSSSPSSSDLLLATTGSNHKSLSSRQLSCKSNLSLLLSLEQPCLLLSFTSPSYDHHNIGRPRPRLASLPSPPQPSYLPTALLLSPTPPESHSNALLSLTCAPTFPDRQGNTPNATIVG